MLYGIFKPLVSIALHAYFKRIDIIGAQRLEEEGVIFVCNHPSALIDPILIACSSVKPIYFLAGAEWFGQGLKSWVLQHEFNMIPVYRPWIANGKENGTEKGKENGTAGNKEMFSASNRSLAQGKRIIIFPEASSKTVPWIRDIKTGAARIKLGADAHIGPGKSIKLIPIGLNYTNANRFQTNVLIHVGQPVDFSDIVSNQSIGEKEKVQMMTDRIHSRMSDLVYYPESMDNYQFIKDAKRILTNVLKAEMGIANGDNEGEFNVRKRIVNEIIQLSKEKPEEVSVLSKRLRAYLSGYETLGFRKYNPFEEKPVNLLLKSLGLLVGFPLFLIGTIYNYPPFALTKWVYKKFFLAKVSGPYREGQINSAFAGTLGLMAGLVIFLIWYVLFLIIASIFLPILLSIGLTMVLGYVSFRFSMIYYKWVVQVSKYLRWKRLQRKHADVIDDILKERQELIKALLNLRQWLISVQN